MSIKTTARRMAGGSKHEHISKLWWQNTATNESGVATRAEMVSFIEKNGNESVWCPDQDPQKKGPWVRVNSNGATKYVQTVADNRWTDNLLSLPEQ